MIEWTSEYLDAIAVVAKASADHQSCILRRSTCHQSVLNYENAYELLQPHRQWLASELRRLLQQFDPLPLIWAVRDIPVESMPIPPLMRQLARRMVEQTVACGRQGEVYNQVFKNIIQVGFHRDELVLIIKALSLAWQYHEVSGLIRSTSLGAEYSLDKNGRLGDLDAGRRRTIRKYIARRSQDKHVLWALAIPLDVEIQNHVSLETMWIIHPVSEAKELRISGWSWENVPVYAEVPDKIEVKYAVRAVFELSQLVRIFKEFTVTDNDMNVIGRELYCKIALAMAVTGRFDNDLSQFINIANKGVIYLQTSAISLTDAGAFASVLEYMHDNYGDVGIPDDLWSVLRVLALERVDSHRQFSGPSVWFNMDGVLVDLERLTNSIAADLAAPSRLDGEAGNAIANYFEQVVRDATAATLKTEKLQCIQGKVLKYNGRDVTDIDALVEIPTGIIFVSCKAVQPGHEYDKIDKLNQRYRLGKKIDEYHASWAKKIEWLSRNRIGDNYDLENVGEFYAVTCLPMVMWHGGYESNAQVSSLPSVCSYYELLKWIKDGCGVSGE